MKYTLKIPLLVSAVLVVAVLTAPAWGGCGFNKRLCNSWCEIRHLGADVNRIACKASCATDELSCLAK